MSWFALSTYAFYAFFQFLSHVCAQAICEQSRHTFANRGSGEPQVDDEEMIAAFQRSTAASAAAASSSAAAGAQSASSPAK